MYLPKHFECSDVVQLHELIKNRPLATVVTLGKGGPNANLIPLYLAPGPGPYGTLRGHVACVNPLLEDLKHGCPVLAVFVGPEHYISPSWYPTKQAHGKVVPTWNYVMVQARGAMRAVDDPFWLREQLDALTRQHESALPQPWSMQDAPEAYIDQMIRAIVGIEMVVEQLAGKWKISQNQPAENHDSVAAHLRASTQAGAAWMADQIKSRHEN